MYYLTQYIQYNLSVTTSWRPGMCPVSLSGCMCTTPNNRGLGQPGSELEQQGVTLLEHLFDPQGCSQIGLDFLKVL